MNLLFETSPTKSGEYIKLYFDRLKKSYLKLKITDESTCKNILTANSTEIYKCLELIFKDDIINMNDYSFVLINHDSNNLIEIKLKFNDKINKFLTKNTIKIYFLNLKEDEQKLKEVNKIITNEVIQNNLTSIIQMPKLKFYFKLTLDQYLEEIKRDSMYKYSNSNKEFYSVTMILYETKIVVTSAKKLSSKYIIY